MSVVVNTRISDADRGKTLAELLGEQATLAANLPGQITALDEAQEAAREADRIRYDAQAEVSKTRKRLAELQAALDDKLARVAR